MLLLSFYRDAMKENLPGVSTIKDYLESNGMLSLFINFVIHKKLFQTLSDEFRQNAFETIKGNKCKVRTYAIFKKEIDVKKYLSNIKDPSNTLTSLK